MRIWIRRQHLKNEQQIGRVNHLIYAAGKDLHNTIRTRIALTEPIQSDALRQAADSAITRYPYFSVRLIREGEGYVLACNDAPLPITRKFDSGEGKNSLKTLSGLNFYCQLLKFIIE